MSIVMYTTSWFLARASIVHKMIMADILNHMNQYLAVEADQLCNFMTHAYVPRAYVPQNLIIDAT